MKNSKFIRLCLVIAFALLGVSQAFSQESDFIKNEGEIRPFEPHFSFEYGLDGGVLTDDINDWMLGANARLQYHFTKKNIVTFTTGFHNIFINNAPDLGYIPLKFGFKRFISHDRFYLLGEFGMGVAATNGYGGSGFLWAPSIGYVSRENSKYDLSLRYESFSKFNMNVIALRLAFEIDFR